MTLATSRVTINVPTYMPLDGQWQIVYPGSVVDLPVGVSIHSSAGTPVTGEAAGTLGAHGKATSVRTVRTR